MLRLFKFILKFDAFFLTLVPAFTLIKALSCKRVRLGFSLNFVCVFNSIKGLRKKWNKTAVFFSILFIYQKNCIICHQKKINLLIVKNYKIIDRTIIMLSKKDDFENEI